MLGHRWSALIGLSALLLIAAAPEERITVQLKLVGVVGAEAVPVTVVFRSPSKGGSKPVQRFEATAPGTTSLPAPSASSWVVEVHAPGYWSAPQSVESSLSAGVLQLDLWRATEVRGTIGVPKGTDVPHAIALRLQAKNAEVQSRLGPTTLVCAVDDFSRFRCTVPRLQRADIRFRVPGFASRFFWDVNLAQGNPLNVGKLTLRPGATVVGHVTTAAPVGLQEVELELSTARRSPYSGPKSSAEMFRGHPDDQGFFSLEGLNPGVYRLVARHPELADAEVVPVRVVEGAQTEIEAPIVLAAAWPLSITVEPLFDPDQGDWQVKVFRSPSPGQLGGSPVIAAATLAGFLRTSGIALGTYEVEVLDSQGQRMLTARINHADDSGIHTLTVDAVRVDGEVTLGGEPLLAELYFSRLAAERVTESDLEGQFHTILPAEGTWDIEVTSRIEAVSWHRRDIEVTAEEGVAALRLDLPDTQISGSVVNEHGEPQAGATIIVENLARTRPSIERKSDQDGLFVFRGLEEDAYQVAASLGDTLSSEPRQIQVREDAESVSRLILQPNRILEGRIVDPAGNALPGTWLLIAAFTEAQRLDTLRDSIGSTDEKGAFRLSLRSSTAHVALMALVPGIGTRSMLLEPGEAGDLMVGPESGTVQLELDAPYVFDRTKPLPVLLTPGGFRVDLGTLVQWASLNGVESTHLATATHFTFPMLEPGPYRLCWMTVTDLASRLSPGDACVAGNLSAGEVLVLHPAPP